MNEKKKVQYKIYQIRDIRGTEYSFVGWEHAAEKFNFSDYKEFYSGEIDQENCLENLFEIFNLKHPLDFKGHSLSVSDVIGIKTENNDHYYWYYCDNVGWKEITELIERSEEESEAKEEPKTIELYIVSGRIDTDVLYPRVFKTLEEAEKEVKDIIYESARQAYEEDEYPDETPDWETLESWADDNGYEFEYYEHRGVYSDGNEYVEAEITMHEIEI